MADKPYKLKTIDGYTQTPFSEDQNGIDELMLGCFEYKCKDYKKCDIGKQHEQFSKFGIRRHRPTSFVGNCVNPQYVFVGEAPGHLGCGTWGLPFYGDNSGYYLYNALYEFGVIPTNIYVTNTIKCCPKGNDLGKYYDIKDRLKLNCVQQIDNEIYGIGGEPRIIALGKVASLTLRELKIGHEMIYHPAYYLRLGQYSKFRDALKEALV
jgi:uracil-DNA glycosylase family 4